MLDSFFKHIRANFNAFAYILQKNRYFTAENGCLTFEKKLTQQYHIKINKNLFGGEFI